MTQPTFAKLVGCSPITIQRIENRTLKMSEKLADRILEATGVNAAELRAGRKAVDDRGQPYTKQSYEAYRRWSKATQHNVGYYLGHSARWLQLLLISSKRAGQDKLPSVFAALQKSFEQIAQDFDLKKNIHGFLLEQGYLRHRTYLVRHLRKFPVYARIIGYSDNKRFKPDKRISFDIPDGWMCGFDYLVETPVFPKEIQKTLRDKEYVIDFNYPIPDTPEFKVVRDALPHVLYWQIRKFRKTFTA